MGFWNAQEKAAEIVAIIDAVLDGRYAEYDAPEGTDIRCFAVSVSKKGLGLCSPDEYCLSELFAPPTDTETPTDIDKCGDSHVDTIPAKHSTDSGVCPKCGGSGVHDLGGPIVHMWVNCPTCHGTGIVNE